MKIGFVTCVELGLSCVRAIYDVGGRLDFLITLPDDRARSKAGRVFLDGFCADHRLPLHKTPHINDAGCVELLHRERPDWLLIIGWSQIASPDVLRATRLGAVGMHPTLLPEGRGRASIPWAILKGLEETGVTMFALDEGVDTGDILAQRRIAIAADETATSLYDRVSDAHAALIRDTWPALVSGKITRTPQDHGRATTWPGRTPADGELRPDDTVVQADRLVRAVTRPYPGAFWREPESGRILRVWSGMPATNERVGEGRVRLRFLDGAYDATSWTWEHEP